jgi:hypothetical protein
MGSFCLGAKEGCPAWQRVFLQKESGQFTCPLSFVFHL